MTVNGVVLPVGDGQQLVHWKGVPVANVTWATTSAELQNTVGQKGIGYELTDEARARGASISLRLEGADQAHFEGTWDTAAGGQVFGQVRCKPRRPGTLEVDLVASVEGRDYRAKLRCDAVADYAMFLQTEATCLLGGAVRTRAGLYAPSTGEVTADAWAACRGLSQTADGETYVMIDGNQAYRVTRSGRTPLLDATEQQQLRNFGAQGISPDGSAVVFGDMSGLYVKRGGPLTLLDAWAGLQVGSRGLAAFSADGRTAVLRAALLHEAQYLRANWRRVDLTDGTHAPLIPSAIANELPLHANRAAFSDDLSKFLWGLSANGELQLHVVDATAGTQVRVFDDAMTHVKTLPGGEVASPIVLTSDQPTMTPDGRYVAIALNAFTDVTYYRGKKGVYVRDLVEGKTWSVGVLPDGAWWSGDGWGYQPRVELTPDGQSVLWGVSWSTGGAGGSYFIVNTLVPRRLWQPI